jgi:RimJ/RimL family protein N-acetyltransferase
MEGVLRATGESADRGLVDDWIGAIRPGQVTRATPEHLAPGSLIARQAALFGAAQPTLRLDGVPGVLRPIRTADRDAIVAMCSDRVAVRWTALPEPYTSAHADTYIGDMAIRGWLRGDRTSFGVGDRDGSLGGLIDLRLSAPDCAEISYVVAPWARGRGYATAAARTLSAWGFETLGLARIEWRAYVGNDTSRRIAEKAGFTIDGTLRGGAVQRGERRDCWIATRLATDIG